MLLPPSNTTATAAIERRLYHLLSAAATAAVHRHRQTTTPTFVRHRCQTLTPAITSTCSRRNSWISYCVHPSCMKTSNAKVLHVFMQLGCKNLQVSLARIWYRLHTQLVTGAFVMPARTTTHVATHHPKKRPHTQKKATTHSHYSATRPWPMPPPSSLDDKTIKICYKDDVDCREGQASSSRRRRHPG